MAEARGRLEWSQTASLMALTANLMRDPKRGKSVNPADFNPYTEQPKPIEKAPVRILQDVWYRKKISEGLPLAGFQQIAPE